MDTTQDKDIFKARVHEYADRLGIDIKSLALRPMKNKWASCSTSGNLNFNAELLEMDKDIANYVIVHELLHLRTPNHGKLWKNLMRAYLGDYETMADRLKTLHIP